MNTLSLHRQKRENKERKAKDTWCNPREKALQGELGGRIDEGTKKKKGQQLTPR